MKKNIFKILGILIFILILRQVDIQLVWEHIRGCQIFLLCMALVIETSCIMPKVKKWQLILNSLGIKANFWDCLRAYWSGLYLAAVTPGKIGDLSRIYFLRDDNLPIGRSIFSVLMDRLTDILSLLLLGIIFSLFYLKELAQLNNLLFIFLIILTLGIWIIFLKRFFFYKLFRKILYKFIPKEKFPLKENLNLDIVKRIKASNYILIFIYIWIGWSIYFLGWWFLTKALYLNISFFHMVAAVSIATIISLIPISISGLGTRDAVILFIFSKIGIVRDSAISFSILIFIIEVFIVCLGIIFFIQGRRTGS